MIATKSLSLSACVRTHPRVRMCIFKFRNQKIHAPQILSVLHLFFLKDYRQNHPEVTVLDPPDAIQHVHNRQSMLQDVADLNLSDCYGNWFREFLR